MIDVRVGYDETDQLFVAFLLRDGEAWTLGARLTGEGRDPGQAVVALIRATRDAWLDEPLDDADRRWLREQLDDAALAAAFASDPAAAWKVAN